MKTRETTTPVRAFDRAYIKQSGIGREGGIFGLEEYLEPKAIIG